MSSLAIHNALYYGRRLWVTAEDGRIAAFGEGDLPPGIHSDTIVDAQGALILPGAIDAHVHFRDPGLTHKADMASESMAAALGGVTSFFDMPNTVPQTTDMARVEEKMAIAAEKSFANYAFFIGVTDDNADEILAADFAKIPGIKLFMGASTGNMQVKRAETLERIFREARVPVVVHAEDDAVISENRGRLLAAHGNPDDLDIALHTALRDARACTTATARAIALAEKYGTHLHIAHLSTAAELEMIKEARTRGVAHITCEVSPHHLLFCEDDYPRLGSRIKMNPSVKSAADRDALRQGVREGHIDIIATDHAPHTPAEKEGGALKAVSGAPMVQFSVPAMLTLFDAETVERCMCANPACIFNVHSRGVLKLNAYADIILVDKNTHTVTDGDVASLCGWTPLAGAQLDYVVTHTFINGAEFPHNQSLPITFDR